MAEDGYRFFTEKTLQFETFNDMQNCLFTAKCKLIKNFWVLEKSTMIIDTIMFLLHFTIIYECLHVPDIVQGIKSGIR